MKISKKDQIYLLNKYNEVRTADRGLFFKKPKSKRIDPRLIPDVIDYYEEGHTQGFFIKKNGVKYVIILGSNQIIDWLFNFWFRLTETPYKESGTRKEIKVHKGFYRSYLKARDIILNKVKKDEKIFVYGQSLGAAIATLAALDIKYNYKDKEVGLMTTGSPRIGNEEFVESFVKYIPESLRYVYGGDIVTTVPPKWLGRRHVIEETHIGPERKVRMSIPDHMMNRYIPGLIEYLNK
jgi:triacylglycerol lipase